MKPIIAAVCFALICTAQCFCAYEKKLTHVLEQLRECTLTLTEELPLVGGPAVGAAATPHEFYLLFPYVSTVATDEDLRAMLRDKSAVVRIMGAKCILQKKDSVLRDAVDLLAKDSTKVYVAPFGCGILRQSVGEVVAELKKDSDFLGDPKGPDQTLEPTAPSGRGSS